MDKILLHFVLLFRMKSITGHPLTIVTEEDVKKARLFYGVDSDRIKESLDAIDEWCKKQDHLVEAYKNLGKCTPLVFYVRR